MGKFFLIIIAISVAILLAMSAYVISLSRRCDCQRPDQKATTAASGHRHVCHFRISRANRFAPNRRSRNFTPMRSTFP